MTTKDKILELTKQYFRENSPNHKKFIPGETYIPPARAYYNEREIMALMSASLDMKWVDGAIVHQFERDMARYVGVRYAIMTNSGSSANLLAISALTSKLLQSRALKPGDEIITVSAGFPTTVNPILQNNLVPVFVDVNIGTYNTTPFLIENAITERTRGIFLAHTLGNPYEIDAIKELCKIHNLWLIEDACFVANTMVSTKQGNKKICDIKIGDKVLGFDGTNFVETEVVDVGSKLVHQDEVLSIYFENGTSVRCTDNHKFYVREKWIRADELVEGDEVYQPTHSDILLWKRKQKLTEDARKKLSERMKLNNPSYNVETIIKSRKNRTNTITKIEQAVIDLIEKNSYPLVYSGNGTYWVGDKENGVANPDFIHLDGSTVYEVYDPTFKYEQGFRDSEWVENKKSFYSKFGYKCVLLPISRYPSQEKMEIVSKEIRKSISNGLKITRISKVRNPNKLNLQKEPKNMVRVYDITCAPYHNFCLFNPNILVHNCDALGAEYDDRRVGSFGNLSTTSLYPAHLISVGEGGMVFTDSPILNKIVRSFRDWGRDCWCLPGKDNTCGKRFCQTDQGDLPDGFDHKYIYSHIGYNLKSTDLQASIGIEQLRKLPEFLEDRRENWEYLRNGFEEAGLQKYFTLPMQLKHSKPAWFGSLLTIRADGKFTRNEITQWLEEQKIGTRCLFGGNLTKQPAYIGKNWIIADIESGLPHSDIISERTFWIGCHPSMNKEMLDYIISKFVEFVKKYD